MEHLLVATFKSIRDELLANTTETGAVIVETYIPGVSEDTLCLPYRNYVKSNGYIENDGLAKGFVISPWSGKSPNPDYVGDLEVLYEDVNFRFRSLFTTSHCSVRPSSNNTLLLRSLYEALVVPDENYKLTSVKVNGMDVAHTDTAASISLNNILGDVIIVAEAELNTHTIDYSNIESNCVESSNTATEIIHGETYVTTLSKKEGYATLGAGNVTVGGVQKDSWNEMSGSKQISVVADGDIYIEATCGTKYEYTAQLAQALSECVTLTGPTSNIEYGSTYTARLDYKQGYINLGAITVTMGTNVVATYPAGESYINLSIPSVNGNIVINGDCGDPADAEVTYIWYDVENQRNLQTLTGTISYGETIQAVDHQNDYTLPVGYEVKSINPTSITGDGTNKTITYNCGLKEYTVTYVGQNVTIPTTSQTVSHGGNVTNTYTVDPGYSGEKATANPSGNVGNVSAQNGTVTVTNVTGNVQITIAAGLSDYTVTYSGNNITLTPSQTVSHGGDVENSYTLDPGYEIVSVTPDDPSKITSVTYDSQKIYVNDVTDDVTITIVTQLKSYTVTYQGDANCNIPANTKQTVQHGGNAVDYTVPVTTGYYVSGVTLDDSTKATATYNDNVVSVTNVTGDVIVTVSSTKKTYTVTFSNCGDSHVNISTNSTTVEHGGNKTVNNVYSISSGYELDSITISQGCIQGATSQGNGEIVLTDVRCDTDICISAKLIPVTTHTVTFQGDTGITLADSQITVNHGANGSTTYTLSSGYLYDGVEICSGHGSVSENNGTITVTNVTEDITVCVHASQGVNPINLYASNMDAMGGVRLYATDGTNFDTNPEHFTINSVNGEACDSENVEVFDYNFVDSNYYDGTDKKTTEGPAIINKKRVNLENTGTSSQSVTLNVTYNGGQGKTDTLRVTQRGESYGYYTGIDNDSSTQDLFDDGNWVNGELVDFGDSSNMYGATTLGEDAYNKDVTPYYIPGTDIGENPILHVDSKATIIKTSSTVESDYNKNNINGHGEHYHISWDPNIPNKGCIFDDERISVDVDFCGEGYTLDSNNCSQSKEYTLNSSTDYTLEALSKDTDVTKTPDFYYTIDYIIPKHSYGRDSISYYHIDDNDDYKSVIEGNKFKKEDGSNNVFSYPVHIKLTNSSNNRYPFKDSYQLLTVRWEDNTYHNNPTDYSYRYYDYNNRIDISNGDVIFAPYNEDCYDDAPGLTQRSLQYNNDSGRCVHVYYTLMSSENNVRPKAVSGVNGGYKFYKLDDSYNSVDRTNDYNNNLNFYEFVDLSNYKTIATGSSEVTPEAYISTDNNHVEPIDNVRYPYYCDANESQLPINTDFSTFINNYTGYEPADYEDSDISKYKHTYYNLCDYAIFEQHYNGSLSSKTHYLHNDSYNKYVACAGEFKPYGYEFYYNLVNISDGTTANWEDIIDNVTTIEKDPDSYSYEDKYIIHTYNLGDYKGILAHTTSTSINGYTYYPELSLTLPTIYLDGSQTNIGIHFWPKDGQEGIHRFIVNGSDTSQLVAGHLAVIYGGSLAQGITEIEIEAFTHPVNPPSFIDASTSGYQDVVHTGGGTFEIIVSWADGDERKMYIPFEGSCGNNNEDASGGKLTWDQMCRRYYLDSGCTNVNDNTIPPNGYLYFLKTP